MKIQHKRSNQLIDGKAKKPTKEYMEYGELAVNFNGTDPAIFLKDSNDNIVRIAGGIVNVIPEAGSNPHQPNTLDDRYVEVTGDNMTGNLTLGDGSTATVVLNASNGTATFTGNVSITNAADDGLLNISGAKNSGIVSDGYFVGTREDTIGGPDGVLRFNILNGVNPIVSVGSNNVFNVANLSIDPSYGVTPAVTSLNADGTATFAGNVTVGPELTVIRDGVNAMGLTVDATTGVPTISFGGSLDFNNGTSIIGNLNPQGDLNLGESDTIKLNGSNGTATFEGNVTVGPELTVIRDGVNAMGLTVDETTGAPTIAFGNSLDFNNGTSIIGKLNPQGDLNLGTTNSIQLNGSVGTATFEGQVTAKGGVGLTSTADDAVIGLLATTPGENKVKLAGQSGETNVLIGNDASGIYTTFQPSGVTEFVSTINIGTGAAAVPGSSLIAYNSSAQGTFYGRNATSGPVYQAANPSGVNATINGDGSASFAGTKFTFTATGDFFVNGDAFAGTEVGIRLFPTGTVAVAGAPAVSQPLFFGYMQGNPTPTVTINSDGTIAGTIVRSASVLIETETDNDDNYAVTTEEYTETESYTGPLGNTLEREVTKTRDIRTYTGPTLDVKERLQNLIARLDSLEADEVADDATSTLLLTTVNNLNADMAKTKAALTAIRTAANAAGTLEQLKADIATATADI